jgi:hypothetical protein
VLCNWRYRLDQPRPPAARAHLAYHDLARSRHHPDPQRGFQRVRTLARRGAGAGGERAAQARSRWRRISCAMGSLHGAPATRGGSRSCTRCAGSARSNAPRKARCGWRRLRPSCPAGWSFQVPTMDGIGLSPGVSSDQSRAMPVLIAPGRPSSDCTRYTSRTSKRFH